MINCVKRGFYFDDVLELQSILAPYLGGGVDEIRRYGDAFSCQDTNQDPISSVPGSME
jgi:hypothetical protein